METFKVPHDIMYYQAVGKWHSGRPLKSLLVSDIETRSGHITFVFEERNKEVDLLSWNPRKISCPRLGMCSLDVRFFYFTNNVLLHLIAYSSVIQNKCSYSCILHNFLKNVFLFCQITAWAHGSHNSYSFSIKKHFFAARTLYEIVIVIAEKISGLTCRLYR
jgi:hypothetical protein